MLGTPCYDKQYNDSAVGKLYSDGSEHLYKCQASTHVDECIWSLERCNCARPFCLASAERLYRSYSSQKSMTGKLWVSCMLSDTFDLCRFKRDSGTLVDPAVQQACQQAFEEGEQLFKNKLVAAALSKYAVASELMPLKTELGGKSRLQKAICLDSLGQNKEAFAVYGLLERHPNADVAKVAKRMIFGFRAMDNLKAHTMSYSVTKGAYDKYFNSLSGDWNAAYVSNDDDSTELTKVIILASAVMLLPLVFLAVKILL